MVMEIYFSKEKAERCEYDIDECYDWIDGFLKEKGIEKIRKGIYRGDDNQKSFDAFMSAGLKLSKTEWFLKIADGWYFCEDDECMDEREDWLEGFRRKRTGPWRKEEKH